MAAISPMFNQNRATQVLIDLKIEGDMQLFAIPLDAVQSVNSLGRFYAGKIDRSIERPIVIYEHAGRNCENICENTSEFHTA